MGFEKGVIRKLADLYPDLKDPLMDIHDNIYDLMIPFRNQEYYSKNFKGSYSIKYVLPSLFPTNEELNYSNLGLIQNGSAASNAFYEMQNMSDEEISKYREALLKYCHLDTYAMVKVWEKLNEVAGISILKTWD